MRAFRANQGRGLRALVRPETREEARPPRLAGNQGSELTGADVLAADDPGIARLANGRSAPARPAETRFHFRAGITSVARWLVVSRLRQPPKGLST